MSLSFLSTGVAPSPCSENCWARYWVLVLTPTSSYTSTMHGKRAPKCATTNYPKGETNATSLYRAWFTPMLNTLYTLCLVYWCIININSTTHYHWQWKNKIKRYISTIRIMISNRASITFSQHLLDISCKRYH